MQYRRNNKNKKNFEKKFSNKILLIHDCAHSFGTIYKDKYVGSYEDIAIYGLNVSKIMTSVFGGMLVSNNAKLIDKIRNWHKKHIKDISIKVFFKKNLFDSYFFLI